MYSRFLVASVALNVLALVALLLNIIPSHWGVPHGVLRDAPVPSLFHTSAHEQEVSYENVRTETLPVNDGQFQDADVAVVILGDENAHESKASSGRAVRGRKRSRREQRAIADEVNGVYGGELAGHMPSGIAYNHEFRINSTEESQSSPAFLSRKGLGATVGEFASSPQLSAISTSAQAKHLWKSYNAAMPLSGPGTLLSLPVFLKFHKVGGTTIAACLRDREEAGDFGERNYWCCDALWQETEEREAHSRGLNRRRSKGMRQVHQMDTQNRRGRALMVGTTASCASGGVAYEHNTLSIFKEHGFRGFQVHRYSLKSITS